MRPLSRRMIEACEAIESAGEKGRAPLVYRSTTGAAWLPHKVSEGRGASKLNLLTFASLVERGLLVKREWDESEPYWRSTWELVSDWRERSGT